MKMRCDRSEMVEKLGMIGGIVPSSTPKPILYDFLLWTRDGALMVEANDLEVAGRVRIDRVEVMEDGKLALPAARLISILREIPDGTAGISIERSGDANAAALSADGYEFKLLGNDPDEFPAIQDPQVGKSLEAPVEGFIQALRRVAVAASRDETRYQLAGVFFEVRGGNLTLTATDGKRLTNDVLKVEDPREVEVEAIVSNRAVDAILKLLGSPSTLGVESRFTLGFNDTQIVVRVASNQLNAQLIEGTYPTYRNALPRSVSIKAKIKRSDLYAAARSAQLMTDDRTSTVVFRFQDGCLNIWSQAKDIGETRIRVKAEVENGPLEIRFNPTYFIDALRCIDDEEVRIEFESQERPGVLRGASHYRHMIMPLVLESR